MAQQDTIVDDFLKEFPELCEHSDIDGDDYSDTPYIFFGVIQRILDEAISNNPDLSTRILKWLDSTLNDPQVTEYVDDMLWIEFFEGSEINELYRTTLLEKLNDKANLKFRQYLYIMENGGLTDAKTGEILKYVKDAPSIPTGKYISDIP